MKYPVFFSWQSDRNTLEGRNLIERALIEAISRISKDLNLEEAVRAGIELDKDTKGVTGTPPVVQTILDKIDQATVFVADLTFVGERCGGKPTPNPNVLIEYGWALKARGYGRIVTVMNAAHGEPTAESMPFDLAYLRFPITYRAGDAIESGTRKVVQAQLAKQLESAIRGVFNKALQEAKVDAPIPTPFSEKEPGAGRARFRSFGQKLGINSSLRRRFFQPDAEDAEDPDIFLSEGPAMWFRMMPQNDQGKTWMISDLAEQARPLVQINLTQASSIGTLRGPDGIGYYELLGNEETPAVAYIFTTGEIWILDAWMSRVENELINLNESAWGKCLEKCAGLLQQMGVAPPYRWIAGMEGIEGRSLPTENPWRTIGPCMNDLVEVKGLYEPGQNGQTVLGPFFDRIFDQCGQKRRTARV